MSKELAEQKSDKKKVWYLRNGNKALDLRSLPRCTALTLKGKPCGNPIMGSSDLCCVHNGHYKPGAPRHNSNAKKHGRFSFQAQANRTKTLDIINDTNNLLTKLTNLI